MAFEEDTEYKLQRRDTPHRMKSIRIDTTKGTERQTMADIVAELMTQNNLLKVNSSRAKSMSAIDNHSLRTAFMTGGCDVEAVQMQVRVQTTLGLNVAGGVGSAPYKGEDKGIYVSRITEGGPADVAGLRVGDKILSVNGVDFTQIDHNRAVDVLKTAGLDFIVNVVREVPLKQKESLRSVDRSPSQPMVRINGDMNWSTVPSRVPSPPQIIYTTLIRDQNGLGFTIRSGVGDSPHTISRIAEGGAADRDRKLMIGDRVLSVNGLNVVGLRHEQVVRMLTGKERFVRLVVEGEGDDVMSSGEKSPRLRSYPGLDASSYLVNRPSYTGSYRRPTFGSVGSSVGGQSPTSPPVTPTAPSSQPTHFIYTKLPGLRNDVVVSSHSTLTLPNSHKYSASSPSLRSSPRHSYTDNWGPRIRSGYSSGLKYKL